MPRKPRKSIILDGDLMAPGADSCEHRWPGKNRVGREDATALGRERAEREDDALAVSWRRRSEALVALDRY